MNCSAPAFDWPDLIVGGLQVLLLGFTWVVFLRQLTAQRTAERAWIIVRPRNWTPGESLLSNAQIIPPQPNKFRVVIKNVGRTPAHNIKVSTAYIRINSLKDVPAEADDNNTTHFEHAILVADESIGRDEFLAPKSILSATEANSIIAAQSFVFFHARVTYSDAFGKPHETRTGFIFPAVQSGAKDYFLTEFEYGGPPGYNRAS